MSALFSELSNPVSNLLNPGLGNGTSLEEKRALELALELTMLNFNDPVVMSGNGMDSLMAANNQQSSGLGSPNMMNSLNAFSALMGNGLDDTRKKSQNMTECVPVPSSEHVAEIVGRQGCKIKALRAKTNTYIKTPVRGEEPVFVVTGRKEDVAKAKREILSAADHFSLIRAARKPSLNGLGKGALPGPPTNIPGQITIQVRVPYRVVGLVVGPKGATIKHIQQQTQTYIVTPSRDKEPVFEVTGLPDNVQTAKRQIEAHIALRTGNLPAGNALNGLLTDEASPELLASLYKNGFNSIFNYLDAQPGQENIQAVANGSTGSSTCSSSSSSSTSSKSAMMVRPELMNIWKSFGSDSLEVDEGIGESPSNIWPMQTGNSTGSVLGSRSSPSVSASPTDSLLGGAIKRDCLVCGDKEVNSALVPCGHSMFCVECANRISTTDSACPVCSQTVIQAIRIIA